MIKVMSEIQKCKIIQLPQLGEEPIGFISVAEPLKNIPFPIQRVYWIYQTPADIIRGQHAHVKLQQVIIAVAGKIKLRCEYLDGSAEEFYLDHPSKGLFVPQMVWRHIEFSENATLLCIASEQYDEKDYIRNYDEFLKLKMG